MISIKIPWRLQSWFTFWVDLVCSVIRIFSFGYLYPTWDMSIRVMWSTYNRKKRN